MPIYLTDVSQMFALSKFEGLLASHQHNVANWTTLLNLPDP